MERAFRELKSDLGLRPIYHQKDVRVEGHIFISILAYHLLHAIEYSLRVKGDNRSWRKIKEVLRTHQAITIVLPDKEGKYVHHIRTVTVPEAEQREIYQKLSIDTNRLKTTMRTYKVSEL